MKNLSDRLDRLEKTVPCDLVALLYVPDKFSQTEREKIKSDIWNEYLRNGGNPNAVLISGLTTEKEPMLKVRKRSDILADIEAGRRKLV